MEGRPATATPGSAPAGEASDFGALRALLVARRQDSDWSMHLAAELATAAFATMPEFASDETLGSLSGGAALSVVEKVVEMVIEGVDPSGATAPPEMVAAARELMSRGEPVERLIRAYHVAHARFFELWAGEVRASVSDQAQIGAAIEQGARWTFAFVDAIGDDIAALGEGERGKWSSSAAAVRLKETRAVLAGTQADAALSSARLGYELGLSHQAFLLWEQEDDAQGERALLLQAAAGELVAGLGAASSLAVPLEENLVAVWVTAPRDPRGEGPTVAIEQLEAGVSAGTVHSGLAGFRRSHEEARAARRIALLRGDSRPRVHYRDVATLDLATRDLDAARAFVARELGPLAGDDRHTVRLAETLRVYLESLGSPRRAAAALGVHENTVTNRVHAAVELLGHAADERVAEMLLALALAPLTRGEPHSRP